MGDENIAARRDFLRLGAMAGAGALLSGCAGRNPADSGGAAAKPAGAAVEVAPNEDLMREHGAIVRLLLVYEELTSRLDRGESAPAEVASGAAAIIRKFAEDYHEKLEENFIFPRLRKAGREVELVEVLLAQHEAGRRVTDRVMALAKSGLPTAAADRALLAAELRAFVRMYFPHIGREETVLFPAFAEVVSPAEYDKLGDQFEDEENRLFGDRGFFKIVDQVAALERQLGIYDLAQFTAEM